jgi:hypothetical protein
MALTIAEAAQEMQVSLAARLHVPYGHAGSMPVAQVRFLAARAVRVEQPVPRNPIRRTVTRSAPGCQLNGKHFPDGIRVVCGSGHRAKSATNFH